MVGHVRLLARDGVRRPQKPSTRAVCALAETATPRSKAVATRGIQGAQGAVPRKGSWTMPSGLEINTTPAHVVGTVADQRPEPPAAMPDTYTTIGWLYVDGLSGLFWSPFVLGDFASVEQAEKQAQRRIEQGHRNVRIIRIPGDAPAQGERHE